MHTRMPPREGNTTLEYKVNVVRPTRPETGALRAVGVAARVGRLVDVAGRLYAQGSTTCLIFDS